MRGKVQINCLQSWNQILHSTSSCLSCSWIFLPPVLQVLSEAAQGTKCCIAVHPACPVPWAVPLHVLAIVPWPCLQAFCLLTKLFLCSLPHFFLASPDASHLPCQDKGSSTARKGSTWNVCHFHAGLSLPTPWNCLPEFMPPYRVGPWHFWEDPTSATLKMATPVLQVICWACSQ